MESRKTELMNYSQRINGDTDAGNNLRDTKWEGEGRTN